MEEQIKEKRVADSLTEQFHEIRPEHLNGADVMFGGILMGWIDVVAGLTAMRHSEGHVLTASVDNLTFLRSLRQHDIVVLIGRVTYVGNSRGFLFREDRWDALSGEPCISDTGCIG